MNRDKQIEEMAKAMCVDGMPNGNCDLTDAPCDLECVYGYCAERLYDKGYRKHTDRFLLKENGELIPLLPKQSEGEWVAKSLTSTSTRGRTIKYSTYKCSVCGTWNGRHKQKYCHECGAKMKGGEG